MGVIERYYEKKLHLESNLYRPLGLREISCSGCNLYTACFILMGSRRKMNKPSIIEITVIALIGGLLGVLFMMPLRNALIVKEHGVLPYPEGTACAEVLLAGEEGEQMLQLYSQDLVLQEGSNSSLTD